MLWRDKPLVRVPTRGGQAQGAVHRAYRDHRFYGWCKRFPPFQRSGYSIIGFRSLFSFLSRNIPQKVSEYDFPLMPHNSSCGEWKENRWVAEIDGRVVGHVAFSPVRISDGTKDWYGLGPVSVLPEYQKQGIGKSLINEGLSLLKQLGGQGCALVGDPNYYKRFGFKNFPELVHEGVPQEVFLALPFNEKIPQGIVVFHEGFMANG
jgi:putative acetyltransferase